MNTVCLSSVTPLRKPRVYPVISGQTGRLAAEATLVEPSRASAFCLPVGCQKPDQIPAPRGNARKVILTAHLQRCARPFPSLARKDLARAWGGKPSTAAKAPLLPCLAGIWSVFQTDAREANLSRLSSGRFCSPGRGSEYTCNTAN